MDRNGFWETTGTHRVHPIVCERSVKYVVFRKGMDYDGAQSMCYNMSMELATVNSSRLPEDLLYTVDRSLSAALDDDDEDSKVCVYREALYCITYSKVCVYREALYCISYSKVCV